MTIAELLQESRRRGLSVREIARSTGVSPTSISRWMNGQGIPDPAYCVKLAGFLGLEPAEVLRIASHLPGKSVSEDLRLQRLIGLLRKANLSEREVDAVEEVVRMIVNLRGS